MPHVHKYRRTHPPPRIQTIMVSTFVFSVTSTHADSIGFTNSPLFSSLASLLAPPQSTGVEAADEVGSSFSQFKLQRAPYNVRYIVYEIKEDKIQIEKQGARGK